MPRTFAYVRASIASQTTDDQIQEIQAAGFKVEPRRVVTGTISGSVATAQRRRFVGRMPRLKRRRWPWNADQRGIVEARSIRGISRLEEAVISRGGLQGVEIRVEKTEAAPHRFPEQTGPRAGVAGGTPGLRA